MTERSLFWHYPLYLVGPGLKVKVPESGRYSWRGFPSSTIVRGRYKLIEYHETNQIELYDLEADPSESHNIAEEKSELAQTLARQLGSWQDMVEAPISTVPNPECILP